MTDSQTTKCARSLACTTPGPQDKEDCLAQDIKDNRTIFVANIIAIIVIGGLGNLLTLVALPYAISHYPSFSNMKTSTTVLGPL